MSHVTQSSLPLSVPAKESSDHPKTPLTISEDQSAHSHYKHQVLSQAFKSQEKQSIEEESINYPFHANARSYSFGRSVGDIFDEDMFMTMMPSPGAQHTRYPTGGKRKRTDSSYNWSVHNSVDASMATSSYSSTLPRDGICGEVLHLNQNAAEDESYISVKQRYIRDLEAKAKSLEDLLREQEPSRLQILYRLKESKTMATYFDYPRWQTDEGGDGILTCDRPLTNLSLYLQRNLDISFIVYRDFSLSEIDTEIKVENESSIPSVKYTSEAIYSVSVDLSKAITSILGSRAEFASLLEDFKNTSELHAPYLFMYHSRHVIDGVTANMSEQSKRQLANLSGYIDTNFISEYETADSLLSRGRISRAYMKYLFKPNDVLVEGQEDEIRAYVSSSWPVAPSRQESSDNLLEKAEDFLDDLQITKKSKVWAWDIEAWSWKFHRNFQREKNMIQLRMAVDSEAEEDIDKLNVRPLKYVDPLIKERLQRRGKTFWDCRFGHLVSYNEDARHEMQNSAGERYMIDMKTYQKLHSNADGSITSIYGRLDDGAMSQSAPPDEEFLLLLPQTILGYNLRQKKWVDLRVDQISKVSWNKDAFKSLVLEEKTKDLIQALVSNQIAAEKSTDLISGKGNGLILLLHGGPGTGKTLTAESVAEIAEKPLYRVTCGDVGTEAEEVEKYLESVLNLGRVWGCVVLLDEADIFLEQRSLVDLKRNALVSVFLRVLEYYDGILILTSNRVGIFDEAFKSRIQLALHYDNLGPNKRLQIWKNFIKRLEDLEEENIDFLDLRDHLDQLAEEKMNGREIRNAMTTARQWAQWKRTTLKYKILKDVIEIAGQFDKYIDQLNGGYTQDQLAEDEGLRLSKPH